MNTPPSHTSAPTLPSRSVPALLADSALFLIVCGAGGLVVVAMTALLFLKSRYTLEFGAATALAESGWPVLSTAAILIASLCCALAYRAIVCAEKTKALILLTIALMAGADFAAVRVIEGMRLVREQNYLMSQAGLLAAPPAAEEAAPDAPADPALGREIYASTCAACHGPNGEGVARLGVPIVGSAFIQARGEAELVAFLKEGRQPSDPQSILRMVMPPRGGNPTLTDKDLKDVSAFISEMAAEAPAETADSQTAAAPAEPAFAIHKSVVPPAKTGPAGLSSFYKKTHGAGPADPILPEVLARPNPFPRLFLFIGIVHGVLLVGGLLGLMGLAIPILRGACNRRLRAVFFFTSVHVQMMVFVWLFLMPFLYGPA